MLTLVFTPSVYGQTKAQLKEAKKQAKALAKEGWHADGGVHSVEYYMLEAENELIEGRASGLINTKVAAAQEYIRINTAYFVGAGAEMQGKMGEETIDNRRRRRQYFHIFCPFQGEEWEIRLHRIRILQ